MQKVASLYLAGSSTNSPIINNAIVRSSKADNPKRSRKREKKRAPETIVEQDNRHVSFWVLIVLFLFSGGTSLIYETIWARQLHLAMGASQLAICAVLAAFMGGLAIGSFLAARWAHLFNRPLLVYAVLEALIGVYAIFFPALLKIAISMYTSFWSEMSPGPTLFTAFQFLILAVLLLPPTICMGATLPLLVRFSSARSSNMGAMVGRLYGANTLGAVMGTALAGFVFLPWFGMHMTTWIAYVANGAVSLVALILGWRVRVWPEPASSIASEVEPRKRLVPVSLGMIAGISGFCGMVYELAWFRLMTLVLGGNAYAFSIMLFAFLLGIGLGGWLGGGLADWLFARGQRRAVVRGLVGLQLGIGLLSWGSMYAYSELPVAFVWLYASLENNREWFIPAQLSLALVLMLPPALLMGATFPCLVRATSNDQDKMNRPVGQLYGINTVGAVLGTLSGGLLLLPWLHMHGAMLVGVSLNAVAALVAYLFVAQTPALKLRFRTLIGVGTTAMAVILIHVFPPPWNPLLMGMGVFDSVTKLESFTREGLLNDIAKQELVWYDEGPSAVVTVGIDTPTDTLWLANNGKIDASTGPADMQTQYLLGHLPFFFRPSVKDVMVIGLGSGVTVGAVTRHESPVRIDVVEIEPAVVEASHFFDDWNERPLEDSRVKVLVNDARNQLFLSDDGTYDLVISEPSNPWISGVSNLFTREFFELGKRKLRKGGMWTQWLHIYGMDSEDLRCLLKTFASTFRYVMLFGGDGADVILLGSDAHMQASLSSIRQALEDNAALDAHLDAVLLPHAEDVLATFLMSKNIILKLAGDVGFNTDDNMRIEYSAPLHLYDSTDATNTDLLRRKYVVIPEFAIEDSQGWYLLSEAYTRHRDDVRARFAFQEYEASFGD